MEKQQKSSFAPRPLRHKIRDIAFVFMAFVLLAACKVELYSGLEEQEANQMMALLMANNIDVEKVSAGETGITLNVEKDQILQAVGILKDNGYPKTNRQSLGKTFEKSGIVSSPFEERVRFIYALGEEVAQTLNQIDGVITARVHIVMPEAPQLGQPVRPSSASVFIKHRPGVDIDFLVPQIKRLVSNAVEGLDYSAVSVVLVEAAPAKTEVRPDKDEKTTFFLGLRLDSSNEGKFFEILYVFSGIIFILLLGFVVFLTLWLRGRRSGKVSGKKGEMVVASSQEGTVVSPITPMEPS